MLGVEFVQMNPAGGPAEAQQAADRIRVVREELSKPELREVLALSDEQQTRFDAWSRQALAQLATQYDVDTTAAQKRVSWGMRIASTLGGIAICAAVVLFFARYWGYLNTPVQVAILSATPLLVLAATEFAARRERTLYFTGLLALVACSSFVMNLVVLGNIFNITSTERALFAWGAFAILLAYRYGLRIPLAFGLVSLISYAAAAITARFGYEWFGFTRWPEFIVLLALGMFLVPLILIHVRNSDFPAVYRLVGAIIFFTAVLSLAEWGVPSYLPFETKTIERLYELLGLLASAGAIWWGIRRQWNGVVNTGSVFFVIFLFTRLYHWWWEWLPKYLFFAVIGALGIVLVLVFKRIRGNLEGHAA